MSNSLLSAAELRLLGTYDTPTVCNVIELFNIRPQNSGYMDQSIKACFPDLPPMVGYAATVTFSAAAPARGDAYATLDGQIAALENIPSPPVIVFQDLDDPIAAATFGEIMCTTYQRFGASGLITSGAGRDLEQVHALQFPVFTSGTICAHGYCRIPSIHVPVRVGGLTVKPGDLLHADRNGVTTIPSEIASEVAQVCADFVRAEAVVLKYLQSGQVTAKGLAEATSECHRMIEELKERIRPRSTRGNGSSAGQQEGSS